MTALDCDFCGRDVTADDRVWIKTPEFSEGVAAGLWVCAECRPTPGPERRDSVFSGILRTALAEEIDVDVTTKQATLVSDGGRSNRGGDE